METNGTILTAAGKTKRRRRRRHQVPAYMVRDLIAATAGGNHRTKDLAEKIGVHPTSLTKWISESTRPTIQHVRRWATAVDLNFPELPPEPAPAPEGPGPKPARNVPTRPENPEDVVPRRDRLDEDARVVLTIAKALGYREALHRLLGLTGDVPR